MFNSFNFVFINLDIYKDLYIEKLVDEADVVIYEDKLN